LLPVWRPIPLIREANADVIREQIVDLAKQVVLIHWANQHENRN
jgi:hypothetical protein